MPEERLKLAVFIDFDNIQIGVKDTLGKEFDVAMVLEELKERGEVVTKVAYGDWPRASEHSRQMTQHAVQMVQRNVTPRGDKNGADINLALDALEMAFTRHHINAFAIVGGDSDFIALVEKLKQYDKRVFVVGGRAFTSNILQRNCTEFIAYENLLKSSAPVPVVVESARPRPQRRGESARVAAASEVRPLAEALPNIQRSLQILAERGVAPQLGLLKSTILQLDSTFSERDYGAGSFLEFTQRMAHEKLVNLCRTDRGFLVEPIEDAETPKSTVAEPAFGEAEDIAAAPGAPTPAQGPGIEEAPAPAASQPVSTMSDAMEVLKRGVMAASEKSPNRPLYMRQVRQGMRTADPNFDERKYGFRGILDLLHQAQREGLIRLQRDHKGVWRIVPLAAPSPSIPAAAGIPVEELPMQGEAAASTDFWESPDTTAVDVEEIFSVEASEEFPLGEPEPVIEEAAPAEPLMAPPEPERVPVVMEAVAVEAQTVELIEPESQAAAPAPAVEVPAEAAAPATETRIEAPADVSAEKPAEAKSRKGRGARAAAAGSSKTTPAKRASRGRTKKASTPEEQLDLHV